jgi:V/A-type H+-transporting ATPase subunit E
MQNKLQELTSKLYAEGLSKGKKEAEELKAMAKTEAEEIIAKAKEEYKEILEKAKREAQDYKTKIENEVRMVSRQTLATVKQNIEEVIVVKAIEKPVKEALENKDFLGTVIKASIEAFNPAKGESASLEILLPEKLKNELDLFLKNDIQKQLNTGVEVKFDKKIQSGFKIGPKTGGYHISFTDKDFQELLSQYLKPKTREYLFSE